MLLSFFFTAPATTEIYTLSLHDALPIFARRDLLPPGVSSARLHGGGRTIPRSEEHTSELQSRGHLVCRLLLEKKKKKIAQKEPLHIGDVTNNLPNQITRFVARQSEIPMY